MLAFAVANYVDFYASEHHATNVGPDLPPGRASAHTELEAPADRLPRPRGDGRHLRHRHPTVRSGSARQRRRNDRVYGPSKRLDIEAEVGFVVGRPAARPRPCRLREFADHVFGLCLLNDWSARDIQAWEYVPLGPFLGKSFATSVAAWITPLDVPRRCPGPTPPAQDPRPLPYLSETHFKPGLDLALRIVLNGTEV